MSKIKVKHNKSVKSKKALQKAKSIQHVKATIVSDDKLPTHPKSHLPVHQDILMAYLMEVRKYPILSQAEEKSLAIKYFETKDAEAASQLVKANLRFVIKIATEYSRLGSKMIDLIQEGNVGLMHAVREYNPYKGVRLITYAVWWIRGYIKEYLLKNYSQVKIATTQSQKKLFYNLQKEIRKLETEGFQPTVKLLSQRLAVPEKDVKTMQLRMSSQEVPIHHPLTMTESSHVQNSIDDDSNENANSIDENLALKEQISLLKNHINEIRPHLNDKELYILDHRFLSDHPLTLSQIGQTYQISKERVRQIEKQLLQKLRKSFPST